MYLCEISHIIGLNLRFSMFQGSFLSVQPMSHLHFLSRFLETSMFSSFVDGKVISRWADREPLQQLFDSRLERERLYDTGGEDSHRCPYRKCTTLFESGTVKVPRIKKGFVNKRKSCHETLCMLLQVRLHHKYCTVQQRAHTNT